MSPALAEGDVEAGREVALTVCARCHVVGAAKPYGEKLDHYRQRVLTLKARRPHKALDPDEISNEDLEKPGRLHRHPGASLTPPPVASASSESCERVPAGLRPGMAYARSIETMIKKYEH